jgi:DUF4097 and DUF4098 domain-containing protein YvlB
MLKQYVMGIVYILVISFPLRGAVEVSVDRVSMSGITHLIIDGTCIAIDITGNNGTDQVEMKGKRLSEDIEVKSTRDNSTLTVWVEHGFPPLPLSCTGKLIFDIPHGVRLTVNTLSGSIDIENCETDTITVLSKSGIIDIERCKALIDLTTASGEVDIEQSQGTLLCDSKSGQVDIEFYNGNLSIHTVSGAQDYEFINGLIDAKTISGSIDIDQFNGELHLESTSGEIDGDMIRCTAHSSFKSNSGEIAIDLLNDFSDFTFELTSKSGTLEAGRRKAKGTLNTGTGTITIRGTTVSGAQEYD